MPWSNQSGGGGGWKGGNGGPWGQGPRNTGGGSTTRPTSRSCCGAARTG